jgi:transposase
MARIRHVIGIDISKKTLDLALFWEGEYSESFKIDNNPEAISIFEKDIRTLGCKVSNTIFCAEETGVYGEFLKKFTEKTKWRVCFDSPLRIHRSLGIVKGKNDKADAIRIGDYALKNLKNLSYYTPPRKIIQDLRYFDTSIGRLSKAYLLLDSKRKCNMEFNLPIYSDAYLRSMSMIENDIKQLEKCIDELIAGDDRLSKLKEVICSVPGIGPKLFRALIITSNEFKSFDCPKKYASYCSIAPFISESGTSLKRRSRGTAIGNKSMKTLLHISVVASLRNKKSHFYKYYTRRKEQNYKGMKLMNALRNKMIQTVFSCVKNMQQYESPGEP